MSKFLVRGASPNSALAWRIESEGESKAAFDYATKSKLFRYVAAAEWDGEKFVIINEWCAK